MLAAAAAVVGTCRQPSCETMKLHVAVVALVAVFAAANAQEMVSHTSATHQLQTNMFSADTAGLGAAVDGGAVCGWGCT
jgi:hypothetical protein